MSLKVKIEPRDCWIGLYWDKQYQGAGEFHTYFYVCLIPCVVIKWTRKTYHVPHS